MAAVTKMPFARVPLLDGIATITANVCKDIMVVVNCAILSTHANTTTVMSMPIVSLMPKLSTKTVMNASAKMVSRVTDTSATFTSHHVTVSLAVTMKSDKLSVTNVAPKHVTCRFAEFTCQCNDGLEGDGVNKCGAADFQGSSGTDLSLFDGIDGDQCSHGFG